MVWYDEDGNIVEFGLEEIAKLWIKMYPEDIFDNSSGEIPEFIIIRDNFKKILEKINKKKK